MRMLFRSLWGTWIGVALLVVCFKTPLSLWMPHFIPELIDNSLPPLQSPSLLHIWGTDELGRDVLVRLLYGTGYSLIFSVGVAFITCLIGLGVGVALSFTSRTLKAFLNSGTDVISALPFLPLALIALSFFPSQITVLGLLKACLGWGSLAQVIRMESDILIRGAMVQSALSQGITRFRIALKYLIPHLIPLAMSFFPLLVFSSLLTIASLDYFGLAFPIPVPNLAEMFRQYQEHPEAWWLFVFPILILSGLLWGFQNIDRRPPNRYPFNHGTTDSDYPRLGPMRAGQL